VTTTRPSTRPNIVSIILANKGFTRTRQLPSRVKGLPLIYRGYEVYSQDGVTLVRYVLGSHNMSPERQREIVAKEISDMERVLSQRYGVVMFEPAEGTGYWLKVYPKKD
jgi:hypothetical protein